MSSQPSQLIDRIVAQKITPQTPPQEVEALRQELHIGYISLLVERAVDFIPQSQLTAYKNLFDSDPEPDQVWDFLAEHLPNVDQFNDAVDSEFSRMHGVSQMGGNHALD